MALGSPVLGIATLGAGGEGTPLPNVDIAIPAGATTFTGYAPYADGPRVIAIPAGAVAFTGRVLSVFNGGRLAQGDLTTQVAIWIRTLPSGNHINTRMRDAMAALYGLNPNISDVTPLFARFTRDRN